MTLDLNAKPAPPIGLIALIAAQLVCAAFFAGDVLADFRIPSESLPYLSVEALACATLVLTILAELHFLRQILQRQAHLQRAASVATAAISEVIEAHLVAWKLTPSEHDIANLLVKGLSIAEIARIRGNAEGTVKSHLNAVYRKSGSQNRHDLLAQILDSLMARDA